MLAACTPDQITGAQDTQAKIANAIGVGCAAVNNAATLAAPFSAVPQVGAILLYANASCADAGAVSALVSKAIADPTTIAWVEKLKTDIKAVTPTAPIKL